MSVAPTAAPPIPWLFSRRLDLVAFALPTVLALVLVAIGLPLGLVAGGADATARDTPEWTWVLCVLAVDVAHVWGNLVLVYGDPIELRRRWQLYLGVPLGALVIALALASEGELWFWRALAALAVWHFIRQQVGWVKLYRSKGAEHGDGWRARLIDEGVVYAVTLGPILWWHAHLPRPFWWLATGDFFVPLPRWAGDAALLLEVLVLAIYAAKSVADARRGRRNLGKHLVVLTTALCWYLGIVACESDYVFTVTNVLIHGIPYGLLIAVTAKRRARAGASLAAPLRHGAILVVVTLVALAFLEEGLWDRLVWHERGWLFALPEVELADLRPFVVACLALPQMTHYVLDGFIWKRRANPYL